MQRSIGYDLITVRDPDALFGYFAASAPSGQVSADRLGKQKVTDATRETSLGDKASLFTLPLTEA